MREHGLCAYHITLQAPDRFPVALKVFAFVLPLGLDTLAIAMALGVRGVNPARPAMLFACFEGGMPLIGFAIAYAVGLRFESAAVVVGGIILVGVGVHAVREAMEGEEELDRLSFTSLRSTFLAGLAISTDELAIGFPLGASKLPLAVVLPAISVQALAVTWLGVAIGNRIGSAIGMQASRFAGIAAGVVFALVGIWLIVERFTGQAT